MIIISGELQFANFGSRKLLQKIGHQVGLLFPIFSTIFTSNISYKQQARSTDIAKPLPEYPDGKVEKITLLSPLATPLL